MTVFRSRRPACAATLALALLCQGAPAPAWVAVESSDHPSSSNRRALEVFGVGRPLSVSEKESLVVFHDNLRILLWHRLGSPRTSDATLPDHLDGSLEQLVASLIGCARRRVLSGQPVACAANGGEASGNGSIAVGIGALAESGGLADGEKAIANGRRARAMARNAMAAGEGTWALSVDALAAGDGAFSIGDGARACGASAIASGRTAKAVGDQACACGTDANQTDRSASDDDVELCNQGKSAPIRARIRRRYLYTYKRGRRGRLVRHRQIVYYADSPPSDTSCCDERLSEETPIDDQLDALLDRAASESARPPPF